MIPLSRSVFWGPMAVAIMGGLVVATVLTLLALPAMYAAWFRVNPAAARRSRVRLKSRVDRIRAGGRVPGRPAFPLLSDLRGWRNW